jgi:hypothetical protein
MGAHSHRTQIPRVVSKIQGNFKAFTCFSAFIIRSFYSSRRSPLSSVSSSESIGPSEISKLTTKDLRVNGSVLMNALTAPPSSSACATLITAVAGLSNNTRALYRDVQPNPSDLVSKSQLQIPTTDAITGALLKTRY